MVSVNKGEWDRSEGVEKDFEFTQKWLTECFRILKDTGTIWISGTMHVIFKIGYALESCGFTILNDIIWFKPNAPPNLSCRYFTHSHETILWAKKGKKAKHIYNYEAMKHWDAKFDTFHNEDKQMRSVWAIPLTPPSEKMEGKHPTQKPLELLNRIITASTNPDDLILDPFNGSGTTGISASLNHRKYIGIDIDKSFLDITKNRFQSLKTIIKSNKQSDLMEFMHSEEE
jgi:site-specific DNA-methyltransferase (adenine-specific)